DPGADRFRRPDAEHLRDRGHRLILARIVGSHLGDHTDSALTKLARILTGTSHKTDPSKESCLRTHRGESLGTFRQQYSTVWSAGWRAKLGLPDGLDEKVTSALVGDLITVLQANRVDYTSFFR